MLIHNLLLEYLTAYNQHDVRKVISFLDSKCRVVFNDQTVMEGVEIMQKSYEKDFANLQANANLIKYYEDVHAKDRIRVLLKTHNNQLIDVTYVFDIRRGDDEFHNQKMIEHIIHSVQSCQDI